MYLDSFSHGFCLCPSFRGWKCAKCDLKENLWLNLTDGTILCGRRYFDGWCSCSVSEEIYFLMSFVILRTFHSLGSVIVSGYNSSRLLIKINMSIGASNESRLLFGSFS